MSFALLNAGAIAFGDHSNLEAYVNTLFHELLSQSQNVGQNNHNRLPLCHVRIDIAHLMKNEGQGNVCTIRRTYGVGN